MRVEIRWSEDRELDAARQAVKSIDGQILAEYDGLLEVDVREDDLDEIERTGLPCSLPEGRPSRAGGLASQPSSTSPRVFATDALKKFATRSMQFGGNTWAAMQTKLDQLEYQYGAAIQLDLSDTARLLEIDTYLVRLRSPITANQRKLLTQLTTRIRADSPTIFRMRLTPPAVALVGQAPGVVEVRRYGMLDTLTEDMARFLETTAIAKPEIINAFDLSVHVAEELPSVESMLSEANATIVSRGPSTIRFTVNAGSDLLPALARMPQVRSLSPFVPPALSLNEARVLVGASDVGTLNPQLNWTGNGEIVAIYDSGVDRTHPALAAAFHAAQPAGDGEQDEHGHGTHVAGIVAGRGNIPGIAPGATILSYRVTAAGSAQITNIPVDLATLLQTAVDAGARIINLSWDINRSAHYDLYASQLDSFVRAHEDVLVVIAAGNYGHARNLVNGKGLHASSTITSPAVAKNGITVGACRNMRSQFQRNWGVQDGASFPAPPASDEPLTGQPIHPSALSSRGPTLFLSAKPDLLAPGTMVLSARAANIPDARYQVHPNDPAPNGYGYMNGTSMAAPIVSGAAALLREFLRTQHATANPSAALLKALLILATKHETNVMQNAVLNQPNIGRPDFAQGFGWLDLRRLLPHPAAPADRKLAYADVLNTDRSALQARVNLVGGAAPHPSKHVYRLEVPNDSHTPLQVSLAWTEPHGKGQQNGLILRVTTPAPVTNTYGNQTHEWPVNVLSVPLGPKIFDENNNLLIAELPDPKAGLYTVTVMAETTATPYQGYALAASGPHYGALTKV